MLRGVASWLQAWRDAIVPLGVVIALLAFAFNVLLEFWRRRAHLSAMFHGAAAVASTEPQDPTPLRVVIESGPGAPSYDRDRYVVLFRNQSHRPTAILDAFPLEANGRALGEVKYRHRIGLPLLIPPWSLVKAFVYLDLDDDEHAAWLRFRDMHGQHLDIRVKVSSMPPVWVKAR